ncbi:hypothetical protein Clacol_008619 [Clathrus columnatus]|uniref:Uncharacterized protein n=1 Tax=Clathrus columnatus TaxID=1419009 RepID=A0AAV5AJ19_9AGAM|nr:hypothetical protein Clacol_008619 [Clathrus columnatus]
MPMNAPLTPYTLYFDTLRVKSSSMKEKVKEVKTTPKTKTPYPSTAPPPYSSITSQKNYEAGFASLQLQYVPPNNGRKNT